MRVYKAHNLNFSPFVPLLFAVKLESRKSTVGPAGWLAGRLLAPPSSPRVVRNSWREAGKFSEERWRHAPRRRANYCRFDLSLPPYHHSSSIRRLPFPFFLHLFVTVPWRHFAKERERKREREREKTTSLFVYLYIYIYIYIGKSAIAFRFLGRQFPFGSRSSTVHLGHAAAP